MDGPQPGQMLTLIRWLKDGPPGGIPIEPSPGPPGSLQAATWEDAGDKRALARLAYWRAAACSSFPDPFPVTSAGARRWLVECFLSAPTRLLFWVKDRQNRPVGHVGLTGIDFASRTARIGEILWEAATDEPLMTAAVHTLGRWLDESFGLRITQETPSSRAA